jgi:hypothetical protein
MIGGFDDGDVYPILIQDDEAKLENFSIANYQNKNGKSILSMAVICGATRCFNLLLKSGADVNHLDAHKRSALYYCIYCANVKFVLVLIEAGAKLNIKFEGTFTPLTMCVMQYRFDSRLKPIIEALLLAGAELPDDIPTDVASWITELAQKVEAHRQLSLSAYVALRKTKQTFLPREIATMIAKMVWENRKKLI